jgi:NADPH:quinone reductase-like Zn-dependent oxidoreductase
MSTLSSRAVRFHEFGEPLDVLREERVDIPDPAPGRIRVRVTAVGLNPADWELCRGFLPGTLPRGVGLDAAGTVDALGDGDGVGDVAIGDAVFGVPDFTGQPSAGAADAAILASWHRIPAGLAPVDAAVLTTAVTTAKWTLDLMGIPSGSTLLVHGAGGTVGFAAVQIALRQGARVIATAGSTFADDLRSFGALVTSYGDGMPDRVRELAGGPIDFVLDTPPPSEGTLPDLIALAGDPGRVVTISNHDEARRLGARVNIDELTGGLPSSDFLAEYAALAAEGSFRIPIARTLPLSEWRTAVSASLGARPHGKLVLLP